MSMPVTEALPIIWGSSIDVTWATASTTQSPQMPAGATAVRLVSACSFFVSASGSASTSGSGQAFVPANVPIILTVSGSMSLSFRAMTSANPNSVNIAPLCA